MSKIINKILICTLCLTFVTIFFCSIQKVKADVAGVNVISASDEADWFHNEKTDEQGTWNVTGEKVTVDSANTLYAMEGANLLTSAVKPLGAYEYQATIHITSLNAVQNPFVGIIPWYVDSENYMYVALKFTDLSQYRLSQAEIADGYAIEQVIFSGRYNNESKYYTATAQQENTVFDALTNESLKNAKLNPLNEVGHTIKVKFEANSAAATSYSVSIYYNDTLIGTSSAYYYNAVARNEAVGFMATDVVAEFSNAYVNDFAATNKTASLARDWTEKNGYTYRMLNGIDVWEFDGSNNVKIDSTSITKDNAKSEYKVSGTNIAGYDTNRGFTTNACAQTAEGLPQNYQIKAKVKLDEVIEFTGKAVNQGYGLLAWYKDDHNFIDVMIRRSVSGMKAAPTIKNQVVLSGWIEYSNALVGENTYDLPEDFDFTAEHTLIVEKKSTGFYVYLDDETTPIIYKAIKGTDINTCYGYEAFNAKYSASAIEVKAIYSSYDEISVLDDNSNSWRVSGVTKDAWTLSNNTIKINAKEASDTLTKRSYIIGTSDISDKNMTIETKVKLTKGSASYAEYMISPYLVDEANYARLGLIVDGDKVYAALRSSTYTDDDMDEDLDPEVIVKRFELSNISFDSELVIKVAKVENTLALYINNELVYGKEVDNIEFKTEDFGIYVYNFDVEISELNTIGYKIYTQSMVGDWLTSGMKYNEWTIDENGYLAGDATYSADMEKNEKDGEKNFAIKKVTVGSDYEMTVDIIATAQTEAEDRVGIMMWYLDEDNFMIFYMDRWRMDSTVPRTTIYGKVNGETLPVTYNHGGWFAEGDQLVETEDGRRITLTESMQVTEWHTIKVVKKGNTFTCYVDTSSNGYISYTVASGLASTDGKDFYAGIYALNDAVLVRNYQVTAIGEASSEKVTPAEAGNAINAYEAPPTLGTYAEKTAEDKFDGAINNERGGENPGPGPGPSGDGDGDDDGGNTNPPVDNPPTNGKKKKCGKKSAELIISLISLTTVLSFVLRKRR